MICRGALGRVVMRGDRFSCRVLRLVLLSARRELRSMTICAARVSSVAANHALPIRRREILATHELSLLVLVNRLPRLPSKSHRRERLLVLSRLRNRSGVRTTGRVALCGHRYKTVPTSV